MCLGKKPEAEIIGVVQMALSHLVQVGGHSETFGRPQACIFFLPRRGSRAGRTQKAKLLERSQACLGPSSHYSPSF